MTKRTKAPDTDDPLAELEALEQAALLTSAATAPDPDKETDKSAPLTPEQEQEIADLDAMIAAEDEDKANADIDALAAVEQDAVLAEAKDEVYNEESDPVPAPIAARKARGMPVPSGYGGGGGAHKVGKKKAAPRVKVPKAGPGERVPVLDVLTAKLGNIEAVTTQVCTAYGDSEAKESECLRRCKLADDLQKKVGEKFVNLISHFANGAPLSVYTVIALRELLTKGEITSQHLHGTYLDNTTRSYGTGTASAQSGQMMQLFPLLEIADRNGQTLTLKPEAPMAIKLAEELGVELAA